MTNSASYRSATTESRQKTILQAALSLFLTKGFSNTTMEDIRQLSGASTGSIYHHFENKEMLAIALYCEGRSALNETLINAFLTDDPRIGLETVVYNYLDWFEQNPDLGLYVIQAASTEYLGRHVEEFRQRIDSLPQHFLIWLTPFIESGRIISYPQHLYIPLALGPSREFVRRWLRKRLPNEIQEAREPLAKVAWQTLRGDL